MVVCYYLKHFEFIFHSHLNEDQNAKKQVKSQEPCYAEDFISWATMYVKIQTSFAFMISKCMKKSYYFTFCLNVQPKFKCLTHTHTHARKHTHPFQRSPARCHGNLVNSTPTVTQSLHQASQSGVGGERRKQASGAQLQFQLVSFHMCKFVFSPWVWRRPRSCSELHTCVASFIEKNSLPLFGFTAAAFLPFRQLHNSPIFF